MLGSVFHMLEPAPLLGHCVLAVCSLSVKSVLSPAKQKWNNFFSAVLEAKSCVSHAYVNNKVSKCGA